MNKSGATDRYAILLLGAVEKPIPSILHLEKESTVLSKISHSREFYHPDGYKYTKEGEDGTIHLTFDGKREFKKLLDENNHDANFIEMINSAAQIRGLYDDMSEDELRYLEMNS